MKLKYRVLFLFVFLFTISYVFTEDNPRVEMFSPQGTVKGVRQVTARFTEQMVPFGDPRAAVPPFETDCSLKGTGRWADSRNWIFDFANNLPAGIRCTFRLRQGLKTLAGKEIKGQREFTFSTGGPSVIRSNPYAGSGYINEEQIFILYLDAEPDKSSVEKNVLFSVEGIQDYIGIRIIEGKERDEILKSQHGIRRPARQPIILIQCRQHFPAGSKVSLVWSKNVMSASGAANTKDQILRYKTRQAFSAEFHCDRENAKADCIPMLPMSLNFSAPVSKNLAGKIVLKDKNGKTWKPELSGDDYDNNAVNGLYFKGPFQEDSAFKIELPRNFKDDSGRPLVNENMFPLTVRTGKFPPLAKFSARFGILELKADPVLPVTMRNLEPKVKAKMLQVGKEGFIGKLMGKVLNVSSQGESIQEWLRRVGSAERDKSVFADNKSAKEFVIPKPSGAAAFEVVGIPIKDPGLYVVEIESEVLGSSLLGRQAPMYVPASVLVTNLSVHFKKGRESSLIWVTALNTGEPVKDAEVTVKDCTEKILWQGKTDADGTAKLNTALPSSGELPNCKYNPIGSGLFITAKLENDFSFVFSSWNEGIEPWRFQLPQDYYSEPTIARTIFDRTLLRAGETVHMKHVLRRHTMNGFAVPAKDKLPYMVTITHYGSDEKFELPLSWDIYGIAETVFTIPRDARLGTYGLIFQTQSSKSRRGYYGGLAGGEFRVEEFRIPLLKGSIIPPAEPQINVKNITLDVNVRYLAGGAAGNLPAKLRNNIWPKHVPAFEGFDEFVFATGPVKEGTERNGQVMDEEMEDETVTEEEDRRKSRGIPSIDLTLDKFGGARVTIPNLPKEEYPQELLTELEYRDPNGELQTISSRTPLWSSGYLIGIKPDSWALSKDNFKFHTAVVDINGTPVAGAPVKVHMFTRKTYSHRKRLVGGFYAYEYMTEVKKVATIFEGKTDSKGLLICDVKSEVSGEVILQAESEDINGNKTTANREVWIAGKDEWWFNVSGNDRIDLLPEKKRYEPGEKAVLQVRMPFRNATALVTVEREGVMESWIKKLSGKEPVIEVPVKGTYAPNCFVSVLAVRGRVSGIQPTAMADMGRPSYKLGIAEIKVGWKAHELKVNVIPERKIYRIREKAKVRIKVKTADGKTPPVGSEAAVAAVDEGLLELMPNQSWNILSAMMGQRPYEISTSTAQMQVVGRRHFGLKALPQGGGGGRQITRELFDTLLFWQGRVKLNNRGEALVEIPLNDSITGFRIVAVVTGGTGYFGTGSTSIKSTQELMMLSGLPPLVREGDRFRAEFTLRNTTKRAMELNASSKTDSFTDGLNPVSVILQPGEAKEIGWDITVPANISKLGWEAEVKEKGGTNRDAIKITQKVVPAVPVSTYQATIAQVEKDFRLSVDQPKDAIPGRGGVRVTLKPKISGGMSGITDYMKSYPYTCLEQKVSTAVALRDNAKWKDTMSGLNSYLDTDGLAKYFPTCYYGDPILTSYIISIANEAEWKLPENAQNRMKAALIKFVEGSITRHSVLQAADLSLKKLTAIEALSRGGGAQPKLLDSIPIEPNLWPTSAVIDWFNILNNIKTIPDRTDRIKEAEQILRSRLNFQGTKMGFSSEGSDCLWWLMVSSDVNSVRLVLSLINAGTWNEDMPRIVLGALARQYKGKWDLTLANAWGVLALEKFSQAFEAVPVSGETRAALSGASQSTLWSTSPKGKSLFFAWPAKKAELSISHKGEGKPWATIQSMAAIPLKEPFSSGYKIRKSIQPIDQKNKDRWTRGDIYRVRLDIEAQADQSWVVVSDPVPAGSTILGKGLARDSQILTKGEEKKGWVSPAFEERSFEAFRAYYEFVPKGKWTVEYTIRVNQSGIFQMPATRVEALYFPEMFGETPNKTIEVLQ